MRPSPLHFVASSLHRLAVACLLALPLLAGCTTDKQVIEQAAGFHDTLKPAVMTDPQLAGYLQKVGDRIIKAASEMRGRNSTAEDEWMYSRNMKFHFVNSKTLNAFTTGGEHMYIYTELFQQCKSEDELAAVMAHEFAHVYGRHVQKGMNRQYALIGAAVGAGAIGYAAGGKDKGMEYAGISAGAAMVAGQFVGMGFTRDDEAEADDKGFDFYTRAGWDPVHFGDFFQQMIDKGYDKGPDYLSDHPSLSKRVAAAKSKAKALPAQAKSWRITPVANASQFKTLQRRSADVGKRMPDDKSLAQAQKILQAMPRSCWTPAIQEDQRKAEQDLLTAAEKGKQQQQQQKKK